MWSYKLVWIDVPRESEAEIEAWEKKLNRHGENEWEAVSVIPQSGRWVILFKCRRR